MGKRSRNAEVMAVLAAVVIALVLLLLPLLKPQPQALKDVPFRKKGRDLFDLYKAIIVAKPNIDRIIKCYHEYMKFVVGKSPTKKQFLINMDEKIIDKDFVNDTASLLRTTEKYNPEEAYVVVKKELLDKL